MPTTAMLRDRIAPLGVTSLAVWTLVVWTGRLGIAWGTSGSTASKVAATVPVVVFVAFGVGVLLTVLRCPVRQLGTAARALVSLFVAWTVVYWLVRLGLILADGHSLGFKAVHTALALLSWTFAAWAWRGLRRGVRAAEDIPIMSDGQEPLLRRS